MLRIVAVRDPTGRYYLSDTVADLPPGTERARWVGSACEPMGLRGPLDGTRMASLLAGCPGTATAPVVRRRTVAGYDLTFAAPKSVSVLAALAPPEVARATVEAHRRAVEDALAYLERRAVSVRVGTGDERQLLPTAGAAGAAFLHATSRSLDPHLHSHVVLANMAQGEDGRWRALDGASLFAHRLAAGELYRASLRAELARRCGVVWEGRRNGTWEVAGIDPALLGAFSGRSAEVRGGRHGEATRLATRPEKQPVGRYELEARWLATARRAGSERGGVGEALGRAPVSGTHQAVDEQRFGRRLHELGEHSVVRRNTAAAWADALGPGAAAGEVERCVARLSRWGSGRGWAEEPRAPAEVVPPAHLVRTLGPRPAEATALGWWQETADHVVSYRTRWDVTDRQHSLGRDDLRLVAASGTVRLAEHLQVARRIDELQRRLGRSAARAVEEQALGRER